jgi:hypothetical protein
MRMAFAYLTELTFQSHILLTTFTLPYSHIMPNQVFLDSSLPPDLLSHHTLKNLDNVVSKLRKIIISKTTLNDTPT